MLLICRGSFFWRQDACKTNMSKIGSIRVASIHECQSRQSSFDHKTACSPKPFCCYTSRTDATGLTCYVFWYGGKGAYETTARTVMIYKRSGLIVWVWISIVGHTDLHNVRNSTLTTKSFADEIQPTCRNLHCNYWWLFSLMHIRGVCWPHTALLVENIINTKTIQRVKGLACSPVLNLIEHVWNILMRHIAARASWIFGTWRLYFLKCTTEFPQSLIDNLIEFPWKTGVQCLRYSRGPQTLLKILHPLFFRHLQIYKLMSWRVTLCSWLYFKELKFSYIMLWFCKVLPHIDKELWRNG